MKNKLLLLLPCLALFASCYQQEKNCTHFQTGKFEFITTIDGVEKKSTFIRTEEYEIEEFEGKIDTSSIRWVSDCEFILQKINPKNMAEQKAVNIKIITTDGDNCVFEYGLVNDARRERGNLRKIGEL